MAEGVRLCRDAAYSGVRILRMFYTEEALERYPKMWSCCGKSGKSFLLSQQLAGGLSATVTPQGIFCVCAMLDKTDCLDKMDASGHLLGLEDIQDPSNLGTILRTAEALGVGGVILTKGCCDIYSPKVLRGSMGAVFRLPLMMADAMEQAVKELKQKGFVTLAAVPNRGSGEHYPDRFTLPTAVLVGNEGNGLKPETVSVCHRRVTIPMLGRAESLNALIAAMPFECGKCAVRRRGSRHEPGALWLWLSLGLGYGGRSGKRVLECFQTPEKFFDASDSQWRSCRLSNGEFFALKPRNLEAAQKIADVCREKEIHLLCPAVKLILTVCGKFNPPVLLYCQGAPRIGGNLVPGGGWYQKGHGGWGKVRF